MKIFIWTEFSPDYTSGLAFAIAESEKEARELVIEHHGFCPSEWGVLEVRELDSPVARSVSGGG